MRNEIKRKKEVNNYMSIRLNKALRELNIGRQTAVDFLTKKAELGEIPFGSATYRRLETDARNAAGDGTLRNILFFLNGHLTIGGEALILDASHPLVVLFQLYSA